MQPDSDPVEAVRAAVGDIDRAHDAAVAAIKAAPDHNVAVAAMNELATHLQALVDADAALQTQVAGRVWDAEKMSLAGLADKVSMSNRRRAELAKDAEEGGASSPPFPDR